MSDRTTLSVTIHHLGPLDQATSVTEILSRYGLQDEYCAVHDDGSQPIPGTTFTNHSSPLWTIRELTDDLVGGAPGTSFTATEGPIYDDLGTLVVYRSELGIYTAPCDAQGEVVLNWTDIASLLDADPDTQELAACLRGAYGRAWLDPATDDSAAARPDDPSIGP